MSMDNGVEVEQKMDRYRQVWSGEGEPLIWVELGWGRSSQQETCNISETGQDGTKVTIDDQ